MALEHVRQEKPREGGERRDVELNLAEAFFQRNPGKLSADAVSGVVNQKVNGELFALQLIEEKLWSNRRSEVERDAPG